jgi:hypothetical protein
MSDEKKIPKPVKKHDLSLPKEIPNTRIEKGQPNGRLDESRIPTFENTPPTPPPTKDKGDK